MFPLNQGKQKGSLTTREITDVLEALSFDADQINRLYEKIERLNIKVVDDFDADFDIDNISPPELGRGTAFRGAHTFLLCLLQGAG